MIKVIFWGTPEFVIPIAEALKKAPGISLAAVVTASDKPVGRKQTLTPSPIKTWAKKHHIPIIDSPPIIRIIEEIKEIKPDLGILAAYGKILPQELIDLFSKGILVIHPSLLPKYRGASPVQAAIINEDEKTGVSIIHMDKQMDHGPIISQFTEPIKPNDTAETLYTRLFQKAANVLVAILPDWLKGKITPREQDHNQATFTHILKREDGYINLENPPSSSVFQRMIRAYHPWPGVWSKWQMANLPRRQAGGKWQMVKFLPEQKIQSESRKPVSVRDFLSGYPETKEWVSKLFSIRQS